MANEAQKGFHVLVVPFPSHGHMLPLLDLAHLLSSRFRLDLTVAVTPVNCPLLSPLLSCSPAITPLVLPFPDYPELPPGIENGKDVAPSQFHLLMHAFGGLHQALLSWARSSPMSPSVIISDVFCGWTRCLATELGIPRLVFSPCSAIAISATHSLWGRMPQRSNSDDPNELVAFPSLPNSHLFHWYELSWLYRSYKQGEPAWEFIKEGFLENMRSWGFVFNTSSELERPYLDHLPDDLGHGHVWAVGPLALPNSSAPNRGGMSSVTTEEVVAWLDGCKEGTMVYVAFGSQEILSPEQAAAVAGVVAEGLERSGSKFIWCVRTGTAVPEGFDGRVAGRGLVIRGWAPQMVILSHPAVGSFVTQCGWNSMLEALAAGVVLLVWPMVTDQFFNARLMADELGIGVRICGRGSAGELPGPDELARVMAESVGEVGKERRERAKELGKRAVAATKEGGSSYKDLEGLVAKLSNLKLDS